MNRCINCGKPTNKVGMFALCDECVEAELEITRLLEEGITLEYVDGSTEVLKIPRDE